MNTEVLYCTYYITILSIIESETPKPEKPKQRLFHSKIPSSIKFCSFETCCYQLHFILISQAVDAATKEQADEQPVLQKDEDKDAENLKEDEEVPMDVDDDDIQVKTTSIFTHFAGL